MEGAVLTSTDGVRFRTHLKNAASALWARTLPKQRRNEMVAVASTTRHHTYPRATQQKRAPISCRLEHVACEPPQHTVTSDMPQPSPETIEYHIIDVDMSSNGIVKFKGSLTREVANVWGSRIGGPDVPAPADSVQSLFNDIELYPTKTQVFEMLVWARHCTRRKSLTLTFGEFCVFAAELRKCSRQARQTKPESPQWSTDKETPCKNLNGSEATPPPYEVFLGGSCNPTTWRSDIAIPMLKKMGITYFNPQVEDWSTELMEVEYRAKAAARALLFVLDSETRAVAASVEAAHLAAAPRDLLLVLRPYSRHATIQKELISDVEYVELSRARATLQEAVERRGLPAFTDIPAALRCAGAVLRGARTHPRHSLGHTILRLKRAFDTHANKNKCIPRVKAIEALRDVTRAPRDVADRCLPPSDSVDFETFCAAVAELVAETESPRNGEESGQAVSEDKSQERVPDTTSQHNGLNWHNERLRSYGKKLGLFIPKTGSGGGGGGTPSPETPLLTPRTERRLQHLPALLGGAVCSLAGVAQAHDVYLGGCFPSSRLRPEEILRREGFTYIVPRVNDYTRMFSAPARRSAPAHPESPKTDKKPRSSLEVNDDVQLRDKPADVEPCDRLSASDFYTVTEDHTPQPFKGTYDEDLLLGSRVILFSMSADSPCFATMVLAAHYMGLRPNATVLLVQTMDAKLATPFSEAAVKDYNRGRHYLMDLAHRSGVPVFDNTENAINCVVKRLRATAIPSSST